MSNKDFLKEEAIAIESLYKEFLSCERTNFMFDAGVIPVSNMKFLNELFIPLSDDSRYEKYIKYKMSGFISYKELMYLIKINSLLEKKKSLKAKALEASKFLEEADKILKVYGTCSLLILNIDNKVSILTETERKSLAKSIFGTTNGLFLSIEDINKTYLRNERIFQEIDGMIDARQS